MFCKNDIHEVIHKILKVKTQKLSMSFTNQLK